jgi:Protein of unknown function (DUF1064).
MAPAKRSKYGAKRTTVDGIVFHSAAESRRYAELRLLERAGQITDLKRQPSFALMAAIVVGGLDNINEGRVTGMRIVGEYRADFSYRERGQLVVEDVKGMQTLPLAAWKIRHMKAQYGITVREIRR